MRFCAYSLMAISLKKFNEKKMSWVSCQYLGEKKIIMREFH